MHKNHGFKYPADAYLLFSGMKGADDKQSAAMAAGLPALSLLTRGLTK